MSIVFEAFIPETPATGMGVLPRMRGRALVGGDTYVGFGRMPMLRQVPGSGIKGPQRLPALQQMKLPFAAPQHLPMLRGRASVVPLGGGVGFGHLPALRGFASVSAAPQITLGFGTLPTLKGSGATKFEMQSTGYGVLPRMRGRAIAGDAGLGFFGAGVLPALQGFGFVDRTDGAGWVSVAQSAGYAYLVGSSDSIALLRDTLIVSSAAQAQWIQVLQDVVALGSSRSALFSAIQVLSDDVILGDSLTLILRALLADTLTVSSTPSSWMGLALALLDTVLLGSVPTASYDAHVMLLLGFALGSVLFDAQRGYLSDDVALADALVQKVNALALLADSWQLASTQSSSAILYALLSDTAAFSDTRADYLAITQVLLDGAQFGLTLYTGQDQYVAWVMTTPTRAMRRYVNYPFNSFGEINGRLCGANANGLYWLDGDTDDGVAIPSMIRSGLMDFGSRQLKRMDRAYLGYTSDGTLGLKVITTSETGDEVAYSYKMIQKPANAPRESRVQIGRGMRSVYWQFELVNEAGSDFELHDLTLLPLILSRRVS
jgi:hypothetical protein